MQSELKDIETAIFELQTIVDGKSDSKSDQFLVTYYKTSSKYCGSTVTDGKKLKSLKKNWIKDSEAEEGLEALQIRQKMLQAYELLLTRISTSSTDSSAKTTLVDDAGISLKSQPTKDDVNTLIQSLEAAQEQVGSNVQQEMVFVQDDMSQFSTYTQGANSAISDATDLLKSLAESA